MWAWNGSAWVLAQDWYTANATANDAWSAVQDMGNDGKLTPSEKPLFFQQVSRIYQEFRELGVPAPVLAGDFQIHSNPLVSPYQVFRDYTLAASPSGLGFDMAWCDIETNFPTTQATQRAALATWMGPATNVTAATYRDQFITVYKAIADLRISGGAKIATTSTLGFVKAGSGLSVAADGTLTATVGGSGTVTSIAGTAPISAATGTTTPVVSTSAATSGAAGGMARRHGEARRGHLGGDGQHHRLPRRLGLALLRGPLHQLGPARRSGRCGTYGARSRGCSGSGA